ncbi:MAG: hypothetical protein ACFFAO_00465 [Candidatus Hermodarchaeota archaeon]
MKELYELGIVFRGFILVNHSFMELPMQNDMKEKNDLRGAFISAISSFAETAFNKNSLEYLESNKLIFIFKLAEIKSTDNGNKEPLILYGLLDKKKKNPDKIVKKFLEKSQIILESFAKKYEGTDFTELDQFANFKENLKNSFYKAPDSNF